MVPKVHEVQRGSLVVVNSMDQSKAKTGDQKVVNMIFLSWFGKNKK